MRFSVIHIRMIRVLFPSLLVATCDEVLLSLSTMVDSISLRDAALRSRTRVEYDAMIPRELCDLRAQGFIVRARVATGDLPPLLVPGGPAIDHHMEVQMVAIRIKRGSMIVPTASLGPDPALRLAGPRSSCPSPRPSFAPFLVFYPVSVEYPDVGQIGEAPAQPFGSDSPIA